MNQPPQELHLVNSLVWMLVFDYPWESFLLFMGILLVMAGFIFLLARYFARPS
jgi:hypothetical protein